MPIIVKCRSLQQQQDQAHQLKLLRKMQKSHQDRAQRQLTSLTPQKHWSNLPKNEEPKCQQ